MAPKNKQKKMALSDFFAEGPAISSWADDDDLALPSAPAPKDPSAPRRGDPNYLASQPDRGARSFTGPPREDIPLPTSPPYTAFIGGLAFESTDSDLSDFFSDLSPTSVRLVKDNTGKAKGFGYVEFANLDGLKKALERSGAQLGGRTLRISVAEAPSNRKEYIPSAAEESAQWRRAGPLPTRDSPAMSSGPRGPGGPGGPGPMSSQFSSAPDSERDWGSARGAKFVPSSNTNGAGAGAAGAGGFGGMRREGSGGGFRREDAPHTQGRYGQGQEGMGPSAADEAGAWRSSKPLVQAPVQQQREREVSAPGLADTESTWSRGTKLRTPVESPAVTAPASPAVPSAAEGEKDWRRPAVPSRGASQEGEARPAAPTERKKLQLAARSSPSSTSTPLTSTPSTAAPSPRASIFGGAKPIDSAAKEAAAAEKLAQMDRDRKAAAAKAAAAAKVEEEGKAGSLAAEREKMIRDAQEKALRDAGLPVPAKEGEKGGRPAQNRQNSNNGNSNNQQQQQRPKVGPAPANAWGRATGANVGKPTLAKPVSTPTPTAGSGSANANAYAHAGAGANGARASAPASAGNNKPGPTHPTTGAGNAHVQPPREPKKKEEKQFDEDGFEVTASRQRKPPASAQAPAQGQAQGQGQGQQQKKSFSWGNVAKTLGGEESNGDKEVEGVSKGVEETKI